MSLRCDHMGLHEQIPTSSNMHTPRSQPVCIFAARRGLKALTDADHPTKSPRFTAKSPQFVTQIYQRIRVRVYAMRIRTDGDNAYRKDVIESAASELDCNKTRAVVASCDIVGNVLPALTDALAEADIPPSEAEQIAEQVSTQHVQINYDGPDVTADID
jgi:hypothetical protein